MSLNIDAMPTFLVFRNGKEVARLTGVHSKNRLLEALGLKT